LTSLYLHKKVKCARHVQSTRQKTVAGRRDVTGAPLGGADQSLTDEKRVGQFAAFFLQAQEKTGDSGDDRRSKAAPAPPSHGSVGHRTRNFLSGGQYPLHPVGFAPIAVWERFSVPIHRSHGEDRWQRPGHVETLPAAIVSGRGDNHPIVLDAIANRASEILRCRAVGRQFPTADVDEMGSEPDGFVDGRGQILLRARYSAPAVLVDWDYDAAAIRCNAFDRAVVTAKDDAGYMCGMFPSESPSRSGSAQNVVLGYVGAPQCRMGEINLPVEQGDASPWIA
jgi:hypothetical protein